MFLFTKQQRLLHKSEFNAVFSNAKKRVNSDFVILVRKNNQSLARLGLAISKKKIAKAHERNRVKRQVREYFRNNPLPAVDVVFIAKKDLSEISNQTIRNNLTKIWPLLAQ